MVTVANQTPHKRRIRLLGGAALVLVVALVAVVVVLAIQLLEANSSGAGRPLIPDGQPVGLPLAYGTIDPTADVQAGAYSSGKARFVRLSPDGNTVDATLSVEYFVGPTEELSSTLSGARDHDVRGHQAVLIPPDSASPSTTLMWNESDQLRISVVAEGLDVDVLLGLVDGLAIPQDITIEGLTAGQQPPPDFEPDWWNAASERLPDGISYELAFSSDTDHRQVFVAMATTHRGNVPGEASAGSQVVALREGRRGLLDRLDASFVSLRWNESPDTVVVVRANGLSDDEVLGIAESMHAVSADRLRAMIASESPRPQ